jgi:hypothetical protein
LGLFAAVTLLAAIGVYFAYPMLEPAKQTTRPASNAVVIFSGKPSELTAAPGNTVQADSSAATISWISSSLRTAKANGTTDGVHVKVPPTLSKDLPGKRIRVTVSARGSEGGLAPFAVAYSTASGRTSGWLVFEPTAQFADYSLNFKVPRAAGSDQYVGIWSDIAGRGTPLAVRQVAITVLP